MRRVFALLCLISLMAAAPAHADEDDDDHDEAHEAVERGAVVPLAEVLARPELQGAGELVRVRLVHDDGRWIYRLRFVDAAGRIRDREVDATRAHGGDPHTRR
jgi:uncharacterized membrane protein YkoI